MTEVRAVDSSAVQMTGETYAQYVRTPPEGYIDLKISGIFPQALDLTLMVLGQPAYERYVQLRNDTFK